MSPRTTFVVFALAGAAALGALSGRWLSPEADTAGGAEAEPAGARACAIFEDESEAGMLWVPGGSFTMGSDSAYPEEGPASVRTVAGFWIDRTEVTNAQFAEFVEATGYVTLAKRGMRSSEAPDAPSVRGSAVFRSREGAPATTSVPYWWEFVEGASWRAPSGSGSSIEGLEHYPVVHVAYQDALAYAEWKGRSLPTEAQFEYAAQSTGHRDAGRGARGQYLAGAFPVP